MASFSAATPVSVMRMPSLVQHQTTPSAHCTYFYRIEYFTSARLRSAPYTGLIAATLSRLPIRS